MAATVRDVVNPCPRFPTPWRRAALRFSPRIPPCASLLLTSFLFLTPAGLAMQRSAGTRVPPPPHPLTHPICPPLPLSTHLLCPSSQAPARGGPSLLFDAANPIAATHKKRKEKKRGGGMNVRKKAGAIKEKGAVHARGKKRDGGNRCVRRICVCNQRCFGSREQRVPWACPSGFE